jgi:hypothetical protein
MKNEALKIKLGKSLTNLQDNTCFCFHNGFDDHEYSGAELKKNPSLVHWFWDENKKEFLPLVVLHNHTAALYDNIKNFTW